MRPNMIAELIKILPPPAQPLQHDESVLRRLERSTRFKYPKDFIEFGKIYGAGTIECAYDWEVWSPFSRNYPLTILQFSRIWSTYNEATEAKDAPYQFFPAVDGLLPFAQSGDGEWVCWHTKGEPDDWTVVDLHTLEKNQYEVLEMGFSEYFYKVLSRQVVLGRHKGGATWNPKSDLKFDPKQDPDQTRK